MDYFKTLLLVLLLFVGHWLQAQDRIVDKTLAKIDFGQDTIQAVYVWIADHVKYDLNKLDDIKSGEIKKEQSEFSSREEYEDYLIERVLKKGKGVCQDYSLLLDALARRLGYDSHIITGYVKNSRGHVNRRLGHCWNAILVNGEWRLYDPTWGAGYVEDGKRFLRISTWIGIMFLPLRCYIVICHLTRSGSSTTLQSPTALGTMVQTQDLMLLAWNTR